MYCKFVPTINIIDMLCKTCQIVNLSTFDEIISSTFFNIDFCIIYKKTTYKIEN